jgi:hypothetical protein
MWSFSVNGSRPDMPWERVGSGAAAKDINSYPITLGQGPNVLQGATPQLAADCLIQRHDSFRRKRLREIKAASNCHRFEKGLA